MKEGVVKFWNKTKGFGFVKELTTSKEYFVHATFLKNRKDSLAPGDCVDFEIRMGKNEKEEAFNVGKI